MPLSELTDLGYEVSLPPPEMGEGMPASINGFGKYWSVVPGDANEEDIVQQAKNHAKLNEKLLQGQQYFADNFANWGSMTAQQKDAANRQAQRALANLCRYARSDLTTEGA